MNDELPADMQHSFPLGILICRESRVTDGNRGIQALTATGTLSAEQAADLRTSLDGEPADPALAALALTTTPATRRDLVLTAAATARSARTRSALPDTPRPELVQAVALAGRIHHHSGPQLLPTSVEIWTDRIVIHLADPDAPAGGPPQHRRWTGTDEHGSRHTELACHGWDTAGVYTQARVFTPAVTATARHLTVNHDAADGEPSFTISLA